MYPNCIDIEGKPVMKGHPTDEACMQVPDAVRHNRNVRRSFNIFMYLVKHFHCENWIFKELAAYQYRDYKESYSLYWCLSRIFDEDHYTDIFNRNLAWSRIQGHNDDCEALHFLFLIFLIVHFQDDFNIQMNAASNLCGFQPKNRIRMSGASYNSTQNQKLFISYVFKYWDKILEIMQDDSLSPMQAYSAWIKEVAKVEPHIKYMEHAY